MVVVVFFEEGLLEVTYYTGAQDKAHPCYIRLSKQKTDPPDDSCGHMFLSPGKVVHPKDTTQRRRVRIIQKPKKEHHRIKSQAQRLCQRLAITQSLDPMKDRMQQDKTTQIKHSADGPKEGEGTAASAEGGGAAPEDEATEEVDRAENGGTY